MVDTAFLWELFLQRLPSNVRMVLAFAGGTQSLEEVADLADKVMDVPAPAVTQINTQFSSDVDQLCLEIWDLKSLFAKPSFNCHPSSPLVTLQSLLDAKKYQPLCTWTGNEQASQWWWPVLLETLTVTYSLWPHIEHTFSSGYRSRS